MPLTAQAGLAPGLHRDTKVAAGCTCQQKHSSRELPTTVQDRELRPLSGVCTAVSSELRNDRQLHTFVQTDMLTSNMPALPAGSNCKPCALSL